MRYILLAFLLVSLTFALNSDLFDITHVEPTENFSINFISTAGQKKIKSNGFQIMERFKRESDNISFHQHIMSQNHIKTLELDPKNAMKAPFGEQIRVKFVAFDTSYDLLLSLDKSTLGQETVVSVDGEEGFTSYYPHLNVYSNLYDEDQPDGIVATFTVFNDLSVEGLVISQGEVMSVTPSSFLAADANGNVAQHKQTINTLLKESDMKTSSLESSDMSISSLTSTINQYEGLLDTLSQIEQKASKGMVVHRLSDVVFSHEDGSPKSMCGHVNEESETDIHAQTLSSFEALAHSVLETSLGGSTSRREARLPLLQRWLTCHPYSNNPITSKVVLLDIIVDYGAALYYSNVIRESSIPRHEFIASRVANLVGQINTIYFSQLGISFRIKNLEISSSTSASPFHHKSYEAYPSSFINTMKIEKYLQDANTAYQNQTPLNKRPATTAVLTRLYSRGGTVGFAYVSTLCTEENAHSVTTIQSTLQTMMTFAHELGHNIGALHTFDPNTECNPTNTDLPQGSQIGAGLMSYTNGLLNAEYGYAEDVDQIGFSHTCNMNQICSYLNYAFAGNPVVIDKRTKTFLPPNQCFADMITNDVAQCGNGILEAGEECDPGLDNSCCKECKYIKPNYTCYHPSSCCVNCIAQNYNVPCGENADVPKKAVGRCDNNGFCVETNCSPLTSSVCPDQSLRFNTCSETCLFSSSNTCQPNILSGSPFPLTIADGACTVVGKPGFCTTGDAGPVCKPQVYRWRQDSLPQCVCGQAETFEPLAVCIDSFDKPVGPGYCEGLPKPPTKVCKENDGCDVEWYCGSSDGKGMSPCTNNLYDYTGFGTCPAPSDSSCGLSTYSRLVACMDVKGNLVDDSFCILKEKPFATAECDSCTYEWRCGSDNSINSASPRCDSSDTTSFFNECKISCPLAFKERYVKCVNAQKASVVDDQKCIKFGSNGNTKPVTQIKCQMSPKIVNLSVVAYQRKLDVKWCYYPGTSPRTMGMLYFKNDQNVLTPLLSVPLSDHVASLTLPQNIGPNADSFVQLFVSEGVKETSNSISTTTACLPSSCSPYGSCRPQDNTCDCLPNYFGAKCKETTCSRASCVMENSVLTDGNPCSSFDSPTCMCRTGFSGDRCQRYSSCTSSCMYGYQKDSCDCRCDNSWEGESCTTCGLTCKNGVPNSSCSACVCNDNYFGSDCLCPVHTAKILFSRTPSSYKVGGEEWEKDLNLLQLELSAMGGIGVDTHVTPNNFGIYKVDSNSQNDQFSVWVMFGSCIVPSASRANQLKFQAQTDESSLLANYDRVWMSLRSVLHSPSQEVSGYNGSLLALRTGSVISSDPSLSSPKNSSSSSIETWIIIVIIVAVVLVIALITLLIWYTQCYRQSKSESTHTTTTSETKTETPDPTTTVVSSTNTTKTTHTTNTGTTINIKTTNNTTSTSTITNTTTSSSSKPVVHEEIAMTSFTYPSQRSRQESVYLNHRQTVAQMTEDPTLPKDWVMSRNKDGRVFYWNNRTQESSWTKPNA